MGISKRYITERIQETPKKEEGTVLDNGNAPGGLFLQTEYWPRCAL